MNILSPLTEEEIAAGGFDRRNALLDAEVCRIMEEEGTSYIKALAMANNRYEQFELVPTAQSYDAVVDPDVFAGNNVPVVYTSSAAAGDYDDDDDELGYFEQQDDES